MFICHNRAVLPLPDLAAHKVRQGGKGWHLLREMGLQGRAKKVSSMHKYEPDIHFMSHKPESGTACVPV